MSDVATIDDRHLASSRAAFAGLLNKRNGSIDSGGPRNQVSTTVTPFGTVPSGLRTSPLGIPMPDLREATPQRRRDAIKNSRFLRNRLGLVKALFENSSRYAVGTGLTQTSTSTDLEANHRIDDYLEERLGDVSFDHREEHTFHGMQGVILPDLMCDGDNGAAKVRHQDTGEPQLQLVPSESIDTGHTFQTPAAKGWKDGLYRPDGGRVEKFRVLQEVAPGFPMGTRPFTDYDRTEFLHIGRFDRIGINRPMPWLAHGNDSAVDILDLTAIEKSAAKINQIFAAAITTKTGEVPVGFEEILESSPETLTTTKADGTTEEKEVKRSYVKFGGVMIPVFAEGEKLEAFKTERPSQVFTGFIDWLVNDISWGHGLPPQFVWALVGMTGPNARMVLQQSDWFFKHLQDILITRFCRRVRNDIVQDGLSRGLIPMPADNAWRAHQWQGPPSMTIDKGRDGKLFMAMIQAGTMSRSEMHEMMGRNGRRQRRKIIEEIAEDIAYCQENQVPLELYFGVNPEVAMARADGSAVTDPENLAEAIVNEMLEQGAAQVG